MGWPARRRLSTVSSLGLGRQLVATKYLSNDGRFNDAFAMNLRTLHTTCADFARVNMPTFEQYGENHAPPGSAHRGCERRHADRRIRANAAASL
jgi:hypothetical protein